MSNKMKTLLFPYMFVFKKNLNLEILEARFHLEY